MPAPRPASRVHALAIVVLVASLPFAAANVNVSDITGDYVKEEGFLDFCTPKLEMAGSSRDFLQGTSIQFDGERCNGSMELRVGVSRREQRKLDFGQRLLGKSDLDRAIHCRGTYLREFVLRRSVRDHVDRPRGFLSDFTYKKGEVYALFTGIPADQDELGRSACMYRRTKAKSNSTDGSSKQEKDSPTVVLWAWLGPVLGAISAIIVGVMACFKKSG